MDSSSIKQGIWRGWSARVISQCLRPCPALKFLKGHRLYRVKYQRSPPSPPATTDSPHEPSRHPKPEVELRGALTAEREHYSIPHQNPEVQLSDTHSTPRTVPPSAIPRQHKERASRCAVSETAPRGRRKRRAIGQTD